MKTRFFLLLCAWFAFPALKAQHCPYDGSHMIVVYLVDQNGKPQSSPSGLVLKERDNPVADSCTYATGQLIIPFDEAVNSLLDKYNGAWKNGARKKSQGLDFMNKGYYVVVLNMSQKTCMIKQGPDFRYTPRSFQVGIEGVFTDVADDSVYALCTGAGDWDRIRAITVIMK